METVHASAVSVDGKGVLIKGPSGSGKSSLAWAMMSHGAELVADDQTVVTVKAGNPWLSAPAAIKGLIEARGIGLLRAPFQDAALALVVDLETTEEHRLPPRREIEVFGRKIPLLHKSITPLFGYLLVHYLTYGRQE